jgi:halogenation protein CepH
VASPRRPNRLTRTPGPVRPRAAKVRYMGIRNAEDVDVVVAGGGPAGSTLATLTAMQGHKVVILEKEEFPRYQIGESLLPATVHGVCRMTGVSDELARSGFTRKRGGTFRWGSSPDPWTFTFSVSPRTAGPTSFAYQVERSKFDKILLDHARRQGVDVREKCAATGVIQDAGRVRGLAYVDAEGNQRQIRANYVVDASGNRSFLYKQIGSRQYSEFFRSLALFGYFDGGKRLPEPNSGNILSAAFDSGWFWYIPLGDTLTSVGAVVKKELASKVQGDAEASYQALIDECPLIKEYLSGATRITNGQYGKLRVRKDYSYHNMNYWRPGMVLIGDAACFVDPVFSSGVHLATYSALLAARSINSTLAGMIDEQAAFTEFELRYRREFRVFYEYLMCFYDLHVSEQSYFWNAKKVTNDSSSELEAFVNLVSGLSSNEKALTGSATLVQRFKDQANEFANAINESAAAEEFSMYRIFNTSVAKEAALEGTHIQSRAVLGDAAEPEKPLFDNGLVASPDGMHWSYPAS